MKKVAVIAPQYPEDIRIYKEINTLKSSYEIDVFLIDTKKTTPRKEKYGTVVVHRFSRSSVSHRLIRYPLSLMRYLRITKAAIKFSPDICHVHDLVLLFSGILVKLFSGCRLIYDAHEDFASMVFQDDTIKISLTRMIELISVRLFVDRVITVNESLHSYFAPWKAKTSILMNVPLLTIQEGARKDSSGPFTIGYIGHIIPGRGYRTLIPVCEYLKQSAIPFTILCVGGGPYKNQFEELIAKNGLDSNFSLTGEVEHDSVRTYLERIHVGLILFKPISYNHLIATPNKLFEYMAYGIPIIASDLPEMRKIIEETGTGILVDPLNAQEIAERIVYLYENPGVAKEMGENGKKAFQTIYNWEAQSHKLLKVYEEILD
jgi:glycosyltransferase involved in cell wall biosynthesis